VKHAETAVVYDLDSTVALTQHRWHKSPHRDPSSDWDKYSAACVDDAPNVGVLARMELDWPHHQVHIVTGRSASSEALTRSWLKRYTACYDYLYMRPSGDNTEPALVRVHYILRLQAQGTVVKLCYEDYDEAARVIYERTGVPVVGINPFYPAQADESLVTLMGH
jgi:hypothetical protein